MESIRNSLFSKILWGFMGLYFLNISVDAADPNPEYIPEDLSFNDQESIIEFILEKVLGYEDAIQEYDDYDSEDHNTKKNSKIDFLVYLDSDNEAKSHFWLTEKKNNFLDYSSHLANGFKEIDSPPPKV
ncbi:hypothetical protein [Winogradskyella sp. SYSU M77433]|uniref:hypothetical protein n=1 Tax=Winogradskyella sp. SYSU M77433 TaxID=3042722 RepID=UPI0024805C86|nr:hypothetical protein [Winogradskyella sp. SYSU M77433]MDH7911400.1 hypothetical protein [Winogradskyella sp. SYSU M77433]